MQEMLQKIIARAGIASRRHAELLIASGQVRVNGRVVRELGTKADAAKDRIEAAGRVVEAKEGRRVYMLLNKPPEVVSAMEDPEGRKTLRNCLRGLPERVFPVGNLEYAASGLVFLTNDGDLAADMLKNWARLEQIYHVKVKGMLTLADLERLGRWAPPKHLTSQENPRTMASERLQKIIAAGGIASRRKAEEIIAAGRVTLNGKVVVEQGTKADPQRDVICVDGKPLKSRERLLYFLLHKPKGYVTTVSDPEGRPTIMELMKKCPHRVYPVGRLDYASEGLLLMTNDGQLAQRLMKAGSHAPKTYLVKISGQPDEQALNRLRSGITIELEDGMRVKTSPAKLRLVEDSANPWYAVILSEGRNRQIRRMFQRVGFNVEKIKRVQLGPLVLDVPPGKYRALTVREVAQLKSL